MEILYLLIPLSAVLVLAIVAVFGWAVHSGQFDDLEREGQRLIVEDPETLDEGQDSCGPGPEQSSQTEKQRVAVP